MKRIAAAVFFVLIPVHGFAKEQLRRFRMAYGSSGHQGLFRDAMDSAASAPAASLSAGKKSKKLLPGVGEFVLRESQKLGKARIAGAWKQSVFSESGELTYEAGAVAEKLPAAADFAGNELKLTNALQSAMGSLAELKEASRVFPPSLETRQDDAGKWQAYWRVEYLTRLGDELRFALIGPDGAAFEKGKLDWDGVDGRAAVFPKGPKFGGVEEATLRDLVGDGTVTGRLLHIASALDLKVWSPQLNFFFAQDDRRFDLGQAYFTIERGYRWLKDHLGVELDHPITVRLHVGDNGVSNAAFYHQNTIYLGTGDGQVYKEMIKDPSILIHEGIHAVIDAYVGLPSEGEGGSFNEGFADLFTALILENPRMGEASYQKGPYRRTLEHSMKAYKDFKPGVYQNGSIIAATFWDMRPLLGTELTAKLAFRTLVRLGKGARFDDLPSALGNAAEGLLSSDQSRQVLEMARNRGWKIP